MKDLKKELPFLPDEKIEELKEIRKRLLDTGIPCMIMLYGSYARGNWRESQGAWSGTKSDLDILALTRGELLKNKLINKSMDMFHDMTTVVQVLVETLGHINKSLEEKDFFYTQIKREGKVLYAEDYLQLKDAIDLTPERLKEIALRDFRSWFGIARQNFKNARTNLQDYLENDNYDAARLAAFNFQQAVENCYTTIEMVFSRNNPYEHRLNILRWNAARYVPDIDKYLTKDTPRKRFLFNHLDWAYIGARYHNRDVYEVTMGQLKYWEPEVERVVNATEKACMEYIEGIC